MAGIYIHIPFCRQACNYCNFHFSTTLTLKDALVDAILLELRERKNYLKNTTIQTIYFGGGTPSLLSIQQISSILETIQLHYTVAADAEITLEANPDDITAELVNAWNQLGINRLSIGIQSVFDEDLVWMNRAHHAQQAKSSIAIAQQNGIHQITIDLIYGSPSLSDEKWKSNVQTAIDFGITHLSCYALTVEPKTSLHHMIATKKLPEVDPEQGSRQFMLLMEWMEAAGFDHYEISNFAKPGFQSKHNTAYWQGKHYSGIGPSAHSFNGESRQWNVANNALYIQGITQNAPIFEIEWLTPIQQLNEYIMTALRTREGINTEWIAEQFGSHHKDALIKNASKYVPTHQIKMEGSYVQLTREGKLFADGIAADLFFE